ncbi:MAG: protein kinase [Pyrinomonadaceae bacterium]|nr:protein kinase [Pyrinomonadaceae bacterium]
MNIERLNQIEEIYHAVLKISPAERPDFFNKICGADVDLRREVESLLAFEKNSEFFLDNPPESLVAQMFKDQENHLDLISKKIAHYKIIKFLGKGGMGEVFLAQDTKLDRQVAIKFLSEEFSKDVNKLKRFIQEAKSISALNHPNILTVHEIGETEGKSYIVTELIEGKTLRERLNHNDRLSLSETMDIVLQIAAAIAAAHEAGIIHRDIKPENIMIRTDGLVKVLDFGLAKLVRGEEWGSKEKENLNLEMTPQLLNPNSPLPTLTNPGMIMGTAAYMSPEQARGKKTDVHSDIWSFGVVFYEMLAGCTPFAGETTSDTIASILVREPAPITEKIPAELQQILRGTLQKKVEERYQTAKELLADLKDAKHVLEFHDKLEGVPNRLANQTQSFPMTNTNENRNQITASPEYFVSQVKNHKFIYLTFTLLLTAGIGFGIYKLSSRVPTKVSVESVKFTKVTDSGKVGEPVALSRDGKYLVYSIIEGEKASIWLKQVALPESNTLILPPAQVKYRAFTFSPDGNYLYYSIEEGRISNCTVYQMPLRGGGTPRKLVSGINGGISFSPDGMQITYGVEDLENDESILMVANADGSEPRQLVKRKGNEEIASSRGRWSPDGKSIALWVGTNAPRTQELAKVSVATSEITQLETPKFDTFVLWEWLSDGNGFVVLASDKPNQKPEFWQITFPTGEVKKITNDLNNYGSMSLTADSNLLATTQAEWLTNISIVSVGDTTIETPITTGSFTNSNPRWTPDGKLVYERITGDIFIVDPHGGSPKRLTTNSTNRQMTVSRDGRYIVNVRTETGTWSIWRMDIDGNNPKQLTTQFSVEPSISPDGQEVIYTVGVDTARIWKVGIDGGQPLQLTDQESRNPVFSPDGKQFACRWWETPDSQPKIAIIPASGGKPVKIFDFDTDRFRWMPDGRSFVYPLSKDGVSNLWSQPIDGGKPKQITNFTNSIHSFDISPDGKQIAIARGTSTSDVVLISGFNK